MSGSTSSGELNIGGGPRHRMALVVALALGTFGIVLAAAPNAGFVGRGIGIIAFAFFGLLGAVALLRLRRAGAVYVLADDGIRFPMSRYPTVPWSRVEDVRIFRAFGQRFLAVDIANPDELAAERGALGKWALQLNLRRGWGAVSISETMAPGTLEELEAQINQRRFDGSVVPNVSVGAPPSRGWRMMHGFHSAAAVVAIHAFVELTGIASATGTGQALRRAAFAILLLGGALLVRKRPKLGVPYVVVVEVALMIVILTLGNYPVSVRILSLGFSLAVVLRLALATAGFREEYRAH